MLNNCLIPDRRAISLENGNLLPFLSEQQQQKNTYFQPPKAEKGCECILIEIPGCTQEICTLYSCALWVLLFKLTLEHDFITKTQWSEDNLLKKVFKK